MGKIVLEIEEFGKTHSEYRILDQDCIRIGRGFDNDVIINDPFVAATHLSLRFMEWGWQCEAAKSVNGVFISDNRGRTRLRMDQWRLVHSGDTIFIGKTVIHLWSADHAVAPEAVLESSAALDPDRQRITRSLLLALTSFYIVNHLYISQWIWKRHESSVQIFAGVCSLILGLVVWSSVWALITRFSRRQHRFLHHLVFSLQWGGLITAVSFIRQYAMFFICSYGLDSAVSLVLTGTATIVILNTHLAIGTNLSPRKRGWISGAFAASIVLLGVLGLYLGNYDFHPAPRHYINLVPASRSYIPTVSIEEHVERLKSIF